MWDSRFNDPLEHTFVTRAKGVGSSCECSLGDHLVTVLYLCTHTQVVSKSLSPETDCFHDAAPVVTTAFQKFEIFVPACKDRKTWVRCERMSGMDVPYV